MLVLSRRTGQRICIGDGVVITVIAASRGGVRIGIEAPTDVPVDREEVRLHRIAEGQTRPAKTVPNLPR